MSLEETLIAHGSPTLAGLKTASLFRITPEDGFCFGRQFKRWKRALASYGLGLVILQGCWKTKSYLLYLYRAQNLRNTLLDPENAAFLHAMGYAQLEDTRRCLNLLASRLACKGAFPHEIGVFLGYPLEDVKGFIRNKGQNYTCCGCWKSYGDPALAQQGFAQFRKCTEIYQQQYRLGVPFTRLIVTA